jgi:lipopolysaccharide/colanic/teichoic acid biosynthesis glycosyltransferase
MDLLLATPAMLVTAPVVAVLAIIVKLNSRGPAFYAQERLGLQGRKIKIYKLRSMLVDADAQGPHVTSRGDSRVTRVGRVLRRLKLDELPQFWNVFRGHLSLVGPRPEATRYVVPDDPLWQEVLSVRPGITDPATIAFRNEEDLLATANDPERAYREVVLPKKLELWRDSIRQRSVGSDLCVLTKTAFAVLGHSPPEHPATDEARRAIERLNQETITQ